MINADQVVTVATEKATKITKSVLTLARVAGVTPAQFAKALADGEANAKYQTKFTAELVEAELVNAIAAQSED